MTNIIRSFSGRLSEDQKKQISDSTCRGHQLVKEMHKSLQSYTPLPWWNPYKLPYVHLHLPSLVHQSYLVHLHQCSLKYKCHPVLKANLSALTMVPPLTWEMTKAQMSAMICSSKVLWQWTIVQGEITPHLLLFSQIVQISLSVMAINLKKCSSVDERTRLHGISAVDMLNF